MKENDDGFLVICLDRRCLILSPDRCGIAKQHKYGCSFLALDASAVHRNWLSNSD